jgi:hypothetical protein
MHLPDQDLRPSKKPAGGPDGYKQGLLQTPTGFAGISDEISTSPPLSQEDLPFLPSPSLHFSLTSLAMSFQTVVQLQDCILERIGCSSGFPPMSQAIKAKPLLIRCGVGITAARHSACQNSSHNVGMARLWGSWAPCRTYRRFTLARPLLSRFLGTIAL